MNFSKSKDSALLLKKRAYRKFFTQSVVLRLIDSSSDANMVKRYWNSWHCANRLEIDSSGKAVSSYCKNRWCAVCQSIRIAKLINLYREPLAEFEEPYFITLTNRSTTSDLDRGLGDLTNRWYSIRKQASKIAPKKWSTPWRGLRKVEVTVSKGLYHPHLHILNDGIESSIYIFRRWLIDSLKDYTKPKHCVTIEVEDKIIFTEVLEYMQRAFMFSSSQYNSSFKRQRIMIWVDRYRYTINDLVIKLEALLRITTRNNLDDMLRGSDIVDITPYMSISVNGCNLTRVTSDQRATSYIELFKYFTKLTTKISDRVVIEDPKHLDHIFRAMSGSRVFQPYGKLSPHIPDDAEEIQTVQTMEVDNNLDGLWMWATSVNDWVNLDTGELLTGFEPTDNILKILKSY